jgi:diadenosine tetraphosphate (Ap4A) HIT family hydrolase
MNNYQVNCFSCLSLQGVKRIPPGNPIFISKYWTLEHKSKSPISGWVVLILNTHKESLNQVSEEEWREFSILLPIIIKVIKKTFICERQYVCQFAAKEGFKHVHWHIIPIANNFPTQYQGSKIFSLLDDKLWQINDTEIIKISEELHNIFAIEMEKFIF